MTSIFDDERLDAAAREFTERAATLGYDATVICFTGPDLLQQVSVEGGNGFIRASTSQPQDRLLLRSFLDLGEETDGGSTVAWLSRSMS